MKISLKGGQKINSLLTYYNIITKYLSEDERKISQRSADEMNKKKPNVWNYSTSQKWNNAAVDNI